LIHGFSGDELEDYVLGKLMEKRLKQRPKDYRSENAVSLDAMIAATEREFPGRYHDLSLAVSPASNSSEDSVRHS
jgi:hypothetical protein